MPINEMNNMYSTVFCVKRLSNRSEFLAYILVYKS